MDRDVGDLALQDRLPGRRMDEVELARRARCSRAPPAGGRTAARAAAGASVFALGAPAASPPGRADVARRRERPPRDAAVAARQRRSAARRARAPRPRTAAPTRGEGQRHARALIARCSLLRGSLPDGSVRASPAVPARRTALCPQREDTPDSRHLSQLRSRLGARAQRRRRIVSGRAWRELPGPVGRHDRQPHADRPPPAQRAQRLAPARPRQRHRELRAAAATRIRPAHDRQRQREAGDAASEPEAATKPASLELANRRTRRERPIRWRAAAPTCDAGRHAVARAARARRRGRRRAHDRLAVGADLVERVGVDAVAAVAAAHDVLDAVAHADVVVAGRRR